MNIDFDDHTFDRLADSLSDAFSEILEVFFEETESSIESLNSYISQENWDEVLNISHKIKSSCKTFGAIGLVKILEKIEATDTNDFEQAGTLQKQFNSEYDLIKNHILNKCS